MTRAEAGIVAKHMVPDLDLHSSGHVMDYSELDWRLTPFYGRRERVEITFRDGYGMMYGHHGFKTGGKVVRCWIGRSTGWKPTYLMILRRDSMGGPPIGGDEIESVKGLGIYR